MEKLLEGLDKKSFKDIKTNFESLNLTLEEKLVLKESFLKDKRKNVIALGNKIEKEIKAFEDEKIRVKDMYDFDRAFAKEGFLAGVDEVGRGPLAGPIVSACVVLDLKVLDEDMIFYLNDSKKLNEKKREELAVIIKEKAISYAIAEKSNEEIDELGIGYCNNKIFLESLDMLNVKPDIVLSDGYLIKGVKIENKSVIKGDTKSATIAAASIIAKVYRDNLMKKYGEKYPEYGFESNVGYGAAKHIEKIKEIGATEIHRMSFLKNILD
ncbi:ribonuclease HII [uncultured Clostridium sp.]|uniref:ribonuclease HII n=1 Tax=uncultured Clostridium sp. TaxID=59620 RepID=UPI002604C9BE|nr:ribonuclease HII [uncultured Clostridium sp.]